MPDMPNVHQAEAIPETARAEIDRLLQSGDLFRYTSENSPVALLEQEFAIALGAQAQFGEKYGDEVRVVSMGQKEDGQAWSLELCGGTHVRQTGDIGLITLLGESAVSSGVRRVEALTGAAARTHLQAQDAKLRQAAAALKSSPDDVPTRVASLLDERKRLERELSEAKKRLAMGGGGGGAAGVGDEASGGSADGALVRTVGDVNFIGRIVEGVSPKDLKGMVDEDKARLGSGVAVMVAKSPDGKGAVVVGVTDDLTDRHDAVQLVRAASAALGGKGGGGRPDMAQAGGPDGSKCADALAAVEAELAN